VFFLITTMPVSAQTQAQPDEQKQALAMKFV
jgi:hypothetical protein